MTISFSCNQCGKKYATPPEFAGKAMKCKQCDTILRIPVPSSPPAAPKSAANRPVAKPAPPEPDLYDLAEPTPIELTEADALESDAEIPVAPVSRVRRSWEKPGASSTLSGSSAAPKNPIRAPKTSSSSVGAKAAGAGIGGLGVLFVLLRIGLRLGGHALGGGESQAIQPPVFAGQPSAPASLVDARRGFQTNLTRRESAHEPVAQPPPGIFEVVKYPSAAGALSAYLTPDPGDGNKHPAIIWITGGDCNTIGDVWTPADPGNDQTAAAFREAGLIMMFPSLRGGNDNPGIREGFLGEVDDVLAAANYLGSQEYVDRSRIYLGGHSTGGTLVFLVAAVPNPFRAIFSFGPAAAVSGYSANFTPFPTSDEREVAVRSPIFWLGSVSKPTFVIEGSGGNIDSLQLMAKNSRNPLLHFFPVQGADHFNILAPATKRIAAKILGDKGPSANSLLQPGELDRLLTN